MGEGERYEEFAPPEPLRPFVRLLWTYAAPRPSGGVQRIAPDGAFTETSDRIAFSRLNRNSLRAELATAGLALSDVLEIPATEAHMASAILVLRTC